MYSGIDGVRAMIRNGADVQAKKNGVNLLHTALLNFPVLQYLLRAYDLDIEQKIAHDHTPLQRAVYYPVSRRKTV